MPVFSFSGPPDSQCGLFYWPFGSDKSGPFNWPKGTIIAASLPDGATLSIATTYAANTAITAITNTNPGVAAAAAHGFVNGDLVEIKSGWSSVNDRIVRVAASTTGNFSLEGQDTTDVLKNPAGSGAGGARKISAWTQITQIMGFTTSGGDQQYTNFSFLEDDWERQLPTMKSAQSLQIEIADDSTLLGYIALKNASAKRLNVALRLALPNGSAIYYNGMVSLNETPTVSKGQVMQVTASMALTSQATRY